MSELRNAWCDLNDSDFKHDIWRSVVRPGMRSWFCIMRTSSEVWYGRWWWWWWYHSKCGVFHVDQNQKACKRDLETQILGNTSCWKATGDSWLCFPPPYTMKRFPARFPRNCDEQLKMSKLLKYFITATHSSFYIWSLSSWNMIQAQDTRNITSSFSGFLECSWLFQAPPLSQILLSKSVVNAALNVLLCFSPSECFYMM